MTPDLINSLFEGFAGLFLWLNVYRLHEDKVLHGASMVPTFLFCLWGYWNLYYYPHLNQQWSFYAGIMVVSANTAWVLQILYYRFFNRKEPHILKESCDKSTINHTWETMP